MESSVFFLLEAELNLDSQSHLMQAESTAAGYTRPSKPMEPITKMHIEWMKDASCGESGEGLDLQGAEQSWSQSSKLLEVLA